MTTPDLAANLRAARRDLSDAADALMTAAIRAEVALVDALPQGGAEVSAIVDALQDLAPASLVYGVLQALGDAADVAAEVAA